MAVRKRTKSAGNVSAGKGAVDRKKNQYCRGGKLFGCGGKLFSTGGKLGRKK